MSRNHLAYRMAVEVSVLQMLALPLLEDPICAAALSELFVELPSAVVQVSCRGDPTASSRLG